MNVRNRAITVYAGLERRHRVERCQPGRHRLEPRPLPLELPLDAAVHHLRKLPHGPLQLRHRRRASPQPRRRGFDVGRKPCSRLPHG